MPYRDTKQILLEEGVIKRCPIDYKAISNLLQRAHVDLKTARRNIKADEECAYTYAYNGMLRTGLALMFSEGFRPDIKNKHQNIIRFASCILGKEFKALINNYDRMRRSRNRFIYEPDIPCSLKEAKDAIKTAEKFVAKISGLIREKHPQKEFSFERKREE